MVPIKSLPMAGLDAPVSGTGQAPQVRHDRRTDSINRCSLTRATLRSFDYKKNGLQCQDGATGLLAIFSLDQNILNMMKKRLTNTLNGCKE
jgi:hypothetical protein